MMFGRKAKPSVKKFDGAGEFAGHRFHVRVDNEGKGVLLIDASRLVFLNGTALDFVVHILEGDDAATAAREMRRRYRGASIEELVEDYARSRAQLLGFVHGDYDIIEVVGSESPLVGADELPSPYRMDIALTYKCQNVCGHCYNETKDKPELGTEDWKRVLEWLWDAGIPHVVFTGGEPTLYPGLRELFAKSEELGQITGLITNGRALARPGLVKDLVDAGMDHVQITLLSHMESLHDELAASPGAWKETVAGIKAALAEDVYLSTNTTIMRRTLPGIEATMRFLSSLGVRNIAFNALIRSGQGRSAEGVSFEELAAALERLKTVAAETGTNMIWYAPTPYCELNPVNMGLGIKQCTACSINMAIEPDGTVIPCQSCYRPVGKALDDWETLWGHETCKAIRERRYMPDKCRECGLVNLCGGGCPLAIEHGDYLCGDRFSNP